MYIINIYNIYYMYITHIYIIYIYVYIIYAYYIIMYRLHLFIYVGRYATHIYTGVCNFLCKSHTIINRYCQLSIEVYIDELSVRVSSRAQNGLAIFRVDENWQTAVKPHRFHFQRAIVAISPVKRRRVGGRRADAAAAAASADQNPDQGVRVPGRGERDKDEIPLDTNSIKPPAACGTRSLSGSDGLLPITLEYSQPSSNFCECVVDTPRILREKFNLCRITKLVTKRSRRQKLFSRKIKSEFSASCFEKLDLFAEKRC